jgi:ABC-type multidrug transport system fused ATPase/permease subunit
MLLPTGRRVLYFYGCGLILLAVLDAIALLLVAQIFSASLAESTEMSLSSSGFTLLVVSILFISKTLSATLVSWLTLKRMAKEEVLIGVSNFDAIMRGGWSERVDSPITDLYNAVDRGPTNMVQGLLMNVVTIFSEAATALLIFLALLLIQPQAALIAVIYFLLVAILQHRILSISTTRAGEEALNESNAVYGLLTDTYLLGKLLYISRSESLAAVLQSSRTNLSIARSRVVFLGTLPRFFMELVLAVGLSLIVGFSYLVSGSQATITTIAVFGAAGFRLLPGINRVQGIVLQLYSTLPVAKLVLLDFRVPAFRRSIMEKDTSVLRLEDINFSYKTARHQVIKNVNLSLNSGQQYALIGPSGAGKTTLVDICLGLLNPESGVIEQVQGLEFAYVPQETYVARASLKQNIALEWDESHIDLDCYYSAIEQSQVTEIFETRDLESIQLSPTSLSGGQKQRIGLARALYRKPDVLFLDEVTSALDAETEHAVMKSIHALHGNTTVVIVAHRLSTVQHADQVIYMDQGQILGIGTFDELRKSIPQLQRQIELGTLDLLD